MIRKAKVQDVKAIKTLISHYAEKDQMLNRSLGELYESIRDFSVYEKDGKVLGTAALHVGWEGLAELRSVAVDKDSLKKGVGRRLVKACIKDASMMGVREIFVLTYVQGFFEKVGFNKTNRGRFLQKVWTECRNKCVKYPDKCNETAMTLKLD